MMDAYIPLILALASLTCAQDFGTNQALDYLSTYNYFDGTFDPSSGHLRSQDSVNEAVRLFQRMNGLEETGIVNQETLDLMQMPRCGLPDNTGTQALDRARRYALSDAKWPQTSRNGDYDLTYRLENTTPDLRRSDVHRIITSALTHWSDVSRLTFTEVTSGNADIIIKFTRATHGDGNPFDGPGQVLAHAFFPSTDSTFSIAGDAHFDEDELFTDGTNDGTNLFQVAVHEFGHSLGLGHSNVPDAIMAAIYRGYVPNAQLHKDDIAGIQALYGAKSGMPEVEGTEGPKAEGSCVANFVAAARTKARGSYIFNDTHAFLMDVYGLVGDAKPIQDVFPGLPTNLDAAFYSEINEKTYFFKGTQYWRFSDLSLDYGYPRAIQDGFGGGIPDYLDAAFVWSGNGLTYFIKGNYYYRYNFYTSQVDRGYPKPLSIWNGIGTKVDAAFQFENEYTYFFTDGEYRRFDDNNFRVASDYPRRSTVWLKCQEMAIVASPQPTLGDGSRGTRGVASSFALCACLLLSLMKI